MDKPPAASRKARAALALFAVVACLVLLGYGVVALARRTGLFVPPPRTATCLVSVPTDYRGLLVVAHDPAAPASIFDEKGSVVLRFDASGVARYHDADRISGLLVEYRVQDDSGKRIPVVMRSDRRPDQIGFRIGGSNGRGEYFHLIGTEADWARYPR